MVLLIPYQVVHLLLFIYCPVLMLLVTNFHYFIIYNHSSHFAHVLDDCDIDSTMLSTVAQQRSLADATTVHILLTADNGSITIATQKPFNANGLLRELVRRLTANGIIGARGGGRPTLAQGGSSFDCVVLCC